MRNRIGAVLLCAAAVLLPALASGAEENVDDLRQELEDLKGTLRELKMEVAKLKGRSESWDATAEKAKTATSGYKDGFYIRSDDGNYEAKLTESFQAQYRSSRVGDTRRDDTFLLRRAETTLAATFFKDYSLKLNYDLATSRLVDGFVNVGIQPWLQWQTGRFKEPFSVEELTSSAALELLGTSLPNNLVPRRDMGTMLHGKIFEGDILAYQLGVFNGDPATRDNDSNSDKDFAARVVLRPFGASENAHVRNLQLGLALTEGTQDLSVAGTGFSTDAGARFFTFANGVRAYDDRSRLGFELAWPIGPCLFRGEYITTEQALRRAVANVWQDETAEMDGWYLQASWILTGGTKQMKVLAPENPFNLDDGCWGCLELVARYSELNLDDDIFDGGYAAAGLWPGDTSSWAVGLNWSPAKPLRLSLDYVHTRYEEEITIEGESHEEEDALMFGVQIVY